MPFIPDIDDFHGSSDIGKIATKAIALARCWDKFETLGREIRPTYFQTLKCRVDGSRQHQTGLLAFNIKTNQYEKRYHLGRTNIDGTSVEYLELGELPFWAINGMGPPNIQKKEK